MNKGKTIVIFRIKRKWYSLGFEQRITKDGEMSHKEVNLYKEHYKSMFDAYSVKLVSYNKL